MHGDTLCTPPGIHAFKLQAPVPPQAGGEPASPCSKATSFAAQCQRCSSTRMRGQHRLGAKGQDGGDAERQEVVEGAGEMRDQAWHSQLLQLLVGQGAPHQGVSHGVQQPQALGSIPDSRPGEGVCAAEGPPVHGCLRRGWCVSVKGRGVLGVLEPDSVRSTRAGQAGRLAGVEVAEMLRMTVNSRAAMTISVCSWASNC